MRALGITHITSCICLGLAIVSCSSPSKQDQPVPNKTEVAKPPSSFHDTLSISSSAVVLYGPDSLQLNKIKAVTDARIFKGSMHEFYYQQRNAHLFLQQYWPQLKIYDVRNIRFLQFIKLNNASEIIDLDKVGDAYGMFVFEPTKSPHQLDMMNIEAQVPDYFQKN